MTETVRGIGVVLLCLALLALIVIAQRGMIAQSIAAYGDSCPCEYSTDVAGSQCGGRSAWTRSGGAEPLCYHADITKEGAERHLRLLERKRGTD